MLQRHNLRLGDGTVLKVDQDELHTWKADARAAVQVAGTQEWRPLREFLAELESAARLARALVPPEPRRAPLPSPPEALPPSPRVELPIGAPPMVQALAEEPASPGTPAPPWSDPRPVAADAPIIRLKPLDDEPRPRAVPRDWASDDEEEDQVRRFDRLDGPVPRRPLAAAPRVPLAPPVPATDLPVLRLADTHEPSEEEEVYESGRSEGPLPTLWLWTKRLVLMGFLVAGGAIAALNWERWFPRAAELGQTVFTEIDRQARSGQRSEEQQQALREATERLPHLGPETIRLVLSASDRGVLDPAEVFQLASEAADRGLHALSEADAAELRALQRELLGNLRPPERARVEEYDRARSRRVVFPFENPHALELVARGARAMSPRSRARLQALLGQAVTAGLHVPASVAP